MRHRISSKALLFAAAFLLFLVPAAAIAAGEFTNVGDGNVFKTDIDWLADAGVAKGCNPPANTRLCPGSNSIDIDAPVAGFITISGSVFISPGGAGLTDLTAKINGVAVDAPDSTFTATESADGSADYTGAYTATMTVTAGSHTLSQELFGAMPRSFHNHGYLTVMFVPTGSHESVAGVTAGSSERG